MKLFDKETHINQLSIDCVIFGYNQKALKVLVTKVVLSNELWALPGGFILQTESIDQAAQRILYQRTGLRDIYLEQFKVFGHTNRTNNEVFKDINTQSNKPLKEYPFDEDDAYWLSKRFISIGYYALVDINKVNPQKVEFDDSIDWYSIKELPKMIMDHNEIVNTALEALRQNLDSKLIGFNLLPQTFTIREVQELYEAVYDKPFARNNFQKKILDMGVLERLEKKFTGAANKAPYLYKFTKLG